MIVSRNYFARAVTSALKRLPKSDGESPFPKKNFELELSAVPVRSIFASSAADDVMCVCVCVCVCYSRTDSER